jgi:hypothetical protein
MPCFVEHLGRSHHQRWQVLEWENVVMRMTRERILASWLPWQWVWLASISSSLLSVWRKDDWCSNIVLAPSSELRFDQWTRWSGLREIFGNASEAFFRLLFLSEIPRCNLLAWSSMRVLMREVATYECSFRLSLPDESFLCFRRVHFRWEHDCN